MSWNLREEYHVKRERVVSGTEWYERSGKCSLHLTT